MQWFGIKKTLKLGLKSLWMHRLRSTLTTLGIVFGVCSVIAMLAIGEGASRETQEAIAKLGSRNLIIETVKPPDEQANTGSAEAVRRYGLTYADAESIRNTIPDVEVAVPIREIDNQARYRNRKVSVKIIGTIPWYTEIAPVRLVQGRFISSTDLHYQMSICVIDDNVARRIFAFEDPVGAYLGIQGSFYKVVGVVETAGVGTGTSTLDSGSTVPRSAGGAAGNVYLPLSTAKIRFSDYVYQRTGTSRSAEVVELQKITVKVQSS
ncbi:MAG: ABC transporter ATP-binding protein, partial [Candidatus Brocadiia bacterium]